MKLDLPLSIDIVPTWTEEHWDPFDPEDRTLGTYYQYAKLKVTGTVKYGGIPIITRHVIGAEMLIRKWQSDRLGDITYQYALGLQTAFDRHWAQGQNLKAKFEAGGSMETSPPPIMSTIENRVEEKLRTLRAEIYQKINVELGYVDLREKTVTPETPDTRALFTKRLDGAKVLIESFVSLRMPLALASDRPANDGPLVS
jgi:hypothetical protein